AGWRSTSPRARPTSPSPPSPSTRRTRSAATGWRCDPVKSAVFKGPGVITLDERETPRIRDKEILIRVRAASFCGTDLKILHGGPYRVGQGDVRVLGHELAGDFEEVGSNVPYWKAGQRVCVVTNIGCG